MNIDMRPKAGPAAAAVGAPAGESELHTSEVAAARRTGGGGANPPRLPPRGKQIGAPDFESRTEIVLERPFPNIYEFGAGVLAAAEAAGADPKPARLSSPLPERGYLVEVLAPLKHEAATRLRFRARDSALPECDGVLTCDYNLPRGSVGLLFVAEGEAGNRIYPVLAQCREARAVAIKELPNPGDSFGGNRPHAAG